MGRITGNYLKQSYFAFKRLYLSYVNLSFIGLDPAGPSFRDQRSKDRLMKTDAL